MTGASTNNVQLSIIVPVLNEVNIIAPFIKMLKQKMYQPQEIIFVDGGSTDGTWEWLVKNHLKVFRTKKGRAHQMNFGSTKASTPCLHFIHVDSHLPQYFDQHLLAAHKKGTQAACFQLKFDSQNWLLRQAAAGSKWNHLLCRGGDQSLFIEKELFIALGGFNPEFTVCEDLHLIKKIYQTTAFTVLPQKIQTSARRFYENGILRLLLHFGVIHLLHWSGASPRLLKHYYSWAVR